MSTHAGRRELVLSATATAARLRPTALHSTHAANAVRPLLTTGALSPPEGLSEVAAAGIGGNLRRAGQGSI